MFAETATTAGVNLKVNQLDNATWGSGFSKWGFTNSQWAWYPYVAMAVVAAIDSAFGGARSYLESTFNDRIFVLAFVSNAAVAALLVWVGDQLGVDLTVAVVVVFGIRIFQNVAAIRRRVFGG